MKTQAILVGAALALGSVITSMEAAKLGDPAAPLTIKEWVKGKPVDILDGKNFYVVEFWATWCGPCRRSIPHLTELQAKFKDKGVVILGISDEDVAKVKPYVEKMGKDMDYVVACDNERESYTAYMRAYGQNGIPHAFVVGKDRKVIWHGHPMAGLEEALEQMVAGKYDVSSALKEDAARAVMDEYLQLSSSGDAKAKELGRKLLADAGDNVQALVDFAFKIVANVRNQNKDFALADEALAKAEKAAGAKDHRILGTRAIALFEAGKQAEGLAMAQAALAAATADADQARYKNYIRVMESRSKKK